MSPRGTFYISDEYGPYIVEFDRQGHLMRRLALPPKFAIANPSADPNAELLGNAAGRQANRGMEGLAMSPDGSTLFGIMQNALIQDHGLNAGTTDRLGLNNRVLKIDLKTGETQEYVYVLEAINRGQGVCEILAINNHEFLVVERDNRSNLQSPPQAPTRKKIYKIDLTGATDVSGVNSLPAGALPIGVVPVTKTLFIDLLAAEFNFRRSQRKSRGLPGGRILRMAGMCSTYLATMISILVWRVRSIPLQSIRNLLISNNSSCRVHFIHHDKLRKQYRAIHS